MFDGVIITDAMEMSAVSTYYDDDEAAVMAVLAGIDMILMPVGREPFAPSCQRWKMVLLQSRG